MDQDNDQPSESAQPETEPAPKKWASAPKLTAQDREDLMLQIEQMLAKSYPRRMIEAAAQTKYGIRPRNVRTYIKRVIDRWAAQSAAESQEAKRADIEAQMREVLHGALTNKIPLRDAAGDPVLDQKGQPIMVNAPDRRAAIRALENLSKLHGLHSTTVNVNAGTSLVDILGKLGDSDMAPDQPSDPATETEAA